MVKALFIQAIARGPIDGQAAQFMGVIAMIAVGLWILRWFVEDEPDPFFLNITFFAFAGQCIRAVELAKESAVDLDSLSYIVGGALLVAIQVAIIKKHHSVTEEYYEEFLTEKLNDTNLEGAAKRWAATISRIARVDFFPGLYGPLKRVLHLKEEPRNRSRIDAVACLPATYFKIGGHDGIHPKDLVVPSSLKRWLLWWAYVGVAAASWGLFYKTMIALQA